LNVQLGIAIPVGAFQGMAVDAVQETAELKQRIRRVLSVFRSVADHSSVIGQNPEEAALHLSGRIGAIARVVLLPVYFEGVDLESLVLDELLAHAAQRQHCYICGSEVRLGAKSAEFMSLIIHELATNSLKFGALCQPRARLRISWRPIDRLGSQLLQFEWIELGVLMKVDQARTPGFGLELIERLIASELGGSGKMDLTTEGAHYTIEIPLKEHRE
jgi:two-component sensor histidine kinase